MTASTGDPWDRAPSAAAEPPGGRDPARAGVRGQAEAAAADLQQHARDLAEDARTRARAAADQQKEAAAERVHGFASALRTAAEDLNGREQRFSASAVEQAADGLERVSGALRERDLDELMGSVEDFARRQPVAFLGGAVLSGLVLARFMKSSAARRQPYASGYAPASGELP